MPRAGRREFHVDAGEGATHLMSAAGCFLLTSSMQAFMMALVKSSPPTAAGSIVSDYNYKGLIKGLRGAWHDRMVRDCGD